MNFFQEQALLKPPVLQLASRDSTGRRFSDGGANIHLFMQGLIRKKITAGTRGQSQVAQQNNIAPHMGPGVGNESEQVSLAYDVVITS